MPSCGAGAGRPCPRARVRGGCAGARSAARSPRVGCCRSVACVCSVSSSAARARACLLRRSSSSRATRSPWARPRRRRAAGVSSACWSVSGAAMTSSARWRVLLWRAASASSALDIGPVSLLVEAPLEVRPTGVCPEEVRKEANHSSRSRRSSSSVSKTGSSKSSSVSWCSVRWVPSSRSGGPVPSVPVGASAKPK